MKHDTLNISEEFSVTISRETAELFFKAVGWQLSKKPPMPPTLATNFREGEFAILKKLEIPLQKVLHGEQKYRFIIDLIPEKKYECKSYVANFHEKTSSKGSMAFYHLQTDIYDTQGNLCVECTSTLIARDVAPKAPSKEGK